MRLRAVAPSLVVAALAALLAGNASAEEPAPPPGWEAAPPLAARGAGGRTVPGGCARNPACSTRQREIDAALPDRTTRSFEVRFEDLPEIVVREAAPGEPPIEGAPGLQFFDGRFRPAPWPDGPDGEVRLVPVGALGQIRWGSKRLGFTPFYRSPRSREGWGDFGAVGGYRGKNTQMWELLTGEVEYTTLDDGPGGALAIDYVHSVLEGSTVPVVGRWGHVEAAPVVDRWVHAFKGWPASDDVERGEGRVVTFMLPGATLGDEANHAEHDVRILMLGRFVNVPAATSVTLPTGPGRSALTRFSVERYRIARWVPQPPGTERPAPMTRLALSSSQTSAEPSPHVPVVIFAG